MKKEFLVLLMLHMISISLQALEMQGKHAEAKSELSKICPILQIFPPEESSVCDLVFLYLLYEV